jgi:hypothetical protein
MAGPLGVAVRWAELGTGVPGLDVAVSTLPAEVAGHYAQSIAGYRCCWTPSTTRADTAGRGARRRRGRVISGLQMLPAPGRRAGRTVHRDDRPRRGDEGGPGGALAWDRGGVGGRRWLTALTGFDLARRRLPNLLTLPGAVAILGWAVTTGRAAGPALAGAAALFAGYLLIHLVAPADLGAGDVKLALGVGALTVCARHRRLDPGHPRRTAADRGLGADRAAVRAHRHRPARPGDVSERSCGPGALMPSCGNGVHRSDDGFGCRDTRMGEWPTCCDGLPQVNPTAALWSRCSKGMVAGLSITSDDIATQLQRRRLGYGRGARMKFEKDPGHHPGRGPARPHPGRSHRRRDRQHRVAQVGDRDGLRSVSRPNSSTATPPATPPLTRPRPGTPTTPGCSSTVFDDARPVLERASARETAARVAVGPSPGLLQQALGVEVVSHVISIGASKPYDGPSPQPQDLAASTTARSAPSTRMPRRP